MIYIYCKRPSESASALVREILRRGFRVRRWRGSHFTPTRGDLVVNWGATHPSKFVVPTLNPVLIETKFGELKILHEAGVKVPPFSRIRGEERGWVGRIDSHYGGGDLLSPPPHPDFYVKRLDIVLELRFHIWHGKSWRSGIKIPREGFLDPSHWVRSFDGGWRVEYGESIRGFIKKKHREAAKQAVLALGYDFGAVDVGETANGKVYVFEVNSAPGLYGNTLRLYAEKVVEGLGR
jgi:hypothetical protein